MNDWKILAVDPADPEFRDTRDVSELSEDRLGEFVEFWSNYMGLSDGHPQTRVRGTAGRKAALAMLSRSEVSSMRDRQKEVSRCDAHADELLERRVKILSQSTPPPDEEFVECLGRVFSPAFFQTRESYDFLVQYGAYQLLRGQAQATRGYAPRCACSHARVARAPENPLSVCCNGFSASRFWKHHLRMGEDQGSEPRMCS